MTLAGYEAAPLRPSPINSNYRLPSERLNTYHVPPSLPRRKSPSPVPVRRYFSHDNYVPSRTIRGDYPNVYRPDVWRPRPSYYSRSPSPDRYAMSRVSENDARDRSHLSPSSSGPSRLDRRRPRSTSRSRERARRDTLATPMFEPSDVWKQAHADRPYRPGVSPSTPVDRYPTYRRRDSVDRPPDMYSARSPPRSQRGGRWPYMHWTNPTYRRYRDDADGSPPRGRNSSGSDEAFRRNPRSYPARSSPGGRDRLPPRSISRSASSRSPSRNLSPRRPFVSGERRSASPSYHPARNVSAMSEVRTYSEDRPQKSARSRSSSRSSIASSRPSDYQRPHGKNEDLPRSRSIEVAPTSTRHTSGPSTQTEAGETRGKVMNGEVSKSKPSLPASLGVFANEEPESKLPIAEHSAHTSQGTVPSVPHVDVTGQERATSLDDQCLTEPLRSQVSHRPGDETTSLPVPPDASNTHLVSSAKTDSRPIHSSGPSLSADSRDLDIPKNELDSALLQARQQVIESPVDTKMEVEGLADVHLSSELTPIPDEPNMDDHHPATCQDDGTSLSSRLDPIVDLNEDDLPKMSDAKSIQDALRVVVMTRLLCDRQTRAERIEPVLLSNTSPTEKTAAKTPAAEELVREFTRTDMRLAFADIKPTLVARFAERQAALMAKTKRLREEYLTLHERWLAHCSRLDNASKPGVLEETAVNAGRTTRRSTALGDAVRSDLEMEQIIASLGNDDLTDPSLLAVRNVAIIPDMISVIHGQVDYLYDNTNHRVENPTEFYAPHTGIHDWTEEEKVIFMDKFTAYPKQFGVIADFLPNKTAAQCVDFYYLHKKTLIDFRKVANKLAPNKRRRGARRDRQKGNGLLADIRRHDDEVHRDSALPSQNGPTTRRRRIMPISTADSRKPGASRWNGNQLEMTPVSTPTPEPDTRQSKRRTNPTARYTVSAAQEEGDDEAKDTEPKLAKKRRRNRRSKPVATAEDLAGETKFIDQGALLSSRRKSGAPNVSWSDEDKNLFLGLLSQYGDDFKRIAASMPNKTTIQVSNYYRNKLVELNLEEVAAGAPKRSPTPEARETLKDVKQPRGIAVGPPATGAVDHGAVSRRPHVESLSSAVQASWLPAHSVEDVPSAHLEQAGFSEAIAGPYASQVVFRNEAQVEDEAQFSHSSTRRYFTVSRMANAISLHDSPIS